MLFVFALLLAAHARPALVPAHPRQDPAAAVNRPMTEEESAALPPGEGRDAVAEMCVPCHGILVSIAQRKTPLAWAATVQDMRAKGARGTDEQAEAASKYLSTHFAAVDVNKATRDELVAIAGFTADEANAIIGYRDAGHQFKSFTDLKKVSGLDAKRLAAAKPRLAYAPK
jgi:competence ComEA-like helix-hairpin-helix protein